MNLLAPMNALLVCTWLICLPVLNAQSDRKLNQEDYYSVAEKGMDAENRKEADALRVETIRSIQTLLKQPGLTSSQEFELRLRLGELYSERHDFIRDQEMEDYDKRYKAWVASGKKGREPSLSNRQSKNFLGQSAITFRDLVRKFPKHRRADAAMFALGKTLSRLNDDQSIYYFKRIIKLHPKSPLIPDTYMALGEYYFDKHKITEAIDYYQKLFQFKDHTSYPYAVYKLGWSFYNAQASNEAQTKQNIQKAIASFKLVVKLTDSDRARQNHRIDLKKEAIQDLVLVWSETEDTKAAWQYFASIGEKDSFYDLLEKLGEIYVQQGKNAKAVFVYTKLLKESPNREKNPEIYRKLVDLYDHLGKVPEQVAALKQMDRLFAYPSTWTRSFDGDQKLLDESKDLVAKTLHRYGALYHNRGQKAKNKTFLKASSQIYAVFLKTFPEREESYEIRYYFADLMSEFKQYDFAADQFTLVAKDERETRFREQSAINAVASLNQADQLVKDPKLPKTGLASSTVPLIKSKQRLVDALDLYVSFYPKKKESHPMMFSAAKILYDYGHYDRAIPRMDKIVADIPKSKQAESSVKLVVNHYIVNKKWSEAEKRVAGYIGNKNLRSKDLSEFLVSAQKNIIFNFALALESDKKHVPAAEKFLLYQSTFPKNDANADRALYNAANNYYKAAELEKAIEASKKLSQTYPNSKLKPNALLDIAQTYEALADFNLAAYYYRAYGVSYPREDKGPNALFNAAILYKGLSNTSEATKAFAHFIKTHPDHSLTVDATEELAKLYEKANNKTEATKMYASLSRKLGSSEPNRSFLARAKIVQMNPNDRTTRNRLVRDLKASNQPALEARGIVAEMEFERIDKDYKNFMAFSLKDPNTIEKRAQQKQVRLENLAKKYEEVMKIKSPEYAVASLFRLGELHENFATSLLSVGNPANADQVAINEFRSSIEKLAFPLRDEAYNFFETAFNKSSEVETFSVWTKRTYDKMSSLDSTKNPQIEEQYVEPSYMDTNLNESEEA